jgi:hypothetical protein
MVTHVFSERIVKPLTIGVSVQACFAGGTTTVRFTQLESTSGTTLITDLELDSETVTFVTLPNRSELSPTLGDGRGQAAAA